MNNYNPNPLKDLTAQQAIYIHGTAEVGSELWRNAGYRLSAIQQINEAWLKSRFCG